MRARELLSRQSFSHHQAGRRPTLHRRRTPKLHGRGQSRCHGRHQCRYRQLCQKCRKMVCRFPLDPHENYRQTLYASCEESLSYNPCALTKNRLTPFIPVGQPLCDLPPRLQVADLRRNKQTAHHPLPLTLRHRGVASASQYSSHGNHPTASLLVLARE